MLVSLTAKLFDLAGAITIDVPAPDWGDAKRRANRIATLDGGAAVNDFGFTDADRTISLTWTANEEENAAIERLTRLHNRVRVATPFGLHECILGGYIVRNGQATLTILPVEKLSE